MSHRKHRRSSSVIPIEDVYACICHNPSRSVWRAAAELARRLGIRPTDVSRYRRHFRESHDWADRIVIIRAISNWCFEIERRDRIARKILELSEDLEGRVFAVFCDPELLVSNDPAEVVRFAVEQLGVRTISVTDVLGRNA